METKASTLNRIMVGIIAIVLNFFTVWYIVPAFIDQLSKGNLDNFGTFVALFILVTVFDFVAFPIIKNGKYD